LGTVVCIHGTPGSVYDFRYVGGELERAGCRVIRLDMPGNDRTSEEVMGGLGDSACGHALARLVEEVIEKTLEEGEKVFVMSHSLGGQVAMNYTLLQPSRVAGLILLSPAPLFVPHRMIRPYWLVHSMTALHKRIDSTPLRPLWRHALRLIWILWGFTPRISTGAVSHGQRRLHMVDFWAQRGRCAKLKQQGVPTLMAWSKNDPMIEPELHHDMSQSLPGGPRLVYKDGGHFINKHHAGPIAAAVVEWMGLCAMREDAL